MFTRLVVRAARRGLPAVLGCTVGLTGAGVGAQVAPRPRPAPVPAPAPVSPAAPRAPLAPLARLDALGPYMAETIVDAMAAVDARGIAEMARAQAALSVDRAALSAATAAMRAELARMPLNEVATIAAEGARMGMETASLAMSMAPLAWDGMTWDASTARSRGYRTAAPEPWDAQDPADSLYRDARRALSGDAYQRAADLFRQIRQKYPKSSYASDAPYWEAFALQRLGGETNLRLAQDALGLQQRDYPRAATRGDAAALNARIEGMLGRRGDAVAAQNVRGRAERAASDGCPRAEEDERVDALNAVTQMDAERAMPILKKVLARREPCTQQLRRTAVWLVARQKSPDAASLLVNTAKTDPDREVREQAVFWLANVSSDDAVTMLVDLARNGDDLDLRKRAVYALSRAKSDKALSTLREIASDSKAPEVLRLEAFGWYLRSAQPNNADPLPFLKTMYASANSDGMKQTVLRYVAGVRSEDARSFLSGLAINDRESLDVRRSAVLFLERLGGLSVVVRTPGGRDSTPNSSASRSAEFASIAKALWQVWEKTDELEIRRQVLSSLARVGDNAGIDKLIDVARNEKNTELRRSAITYLSRSKDPRAIELLQEIINK
ncbi:HEAT repeat domain-containing protein [Gemmatimonas sp.]